jgi:hypothetical protein
MPRGVPGSTTTDGTTSTRSRGRRSVANRKLITTGLIQSGSIPGLNKIQGKDAQLFADALVMTCNTAIAGNAWGTLSGPDFVNLVVTNYDQMAHRT